MKQLFYISILCYCCCDIHAIHYTQLDSVSMPIQRLCTSKNTQSIWGDMGNFIDDFTNEVAYSVRNDIVNSNNFWNTARKLICEHSDDEEKHAKIIADVQHYLSGVEVIPVAYLSQHGNKKIVLSGQIYLPRNGQINNIILAHHYTIGANREAPSQTYTFEALLAAKGYIVLMPDYLGFGLTKDSIHPYLNANMAAHASVDMLNAAIPFLYHRNVRISSSQLILCGYSQGAAASLATQRLIETSYSKYSIRENYVGAGPYSPSDTYDYCIAQDVTNIPCAIPMLLQGMLVSENLTYNLEDFLLPPLRENYNNWINSKLYSINQINTYIGSFRISEILTPLARNKLLYPTNTFYEALKHNKIDAWTPHGRIYMFHSYSDDMVPFINSTIIKDYFESIGFSNIEYDFDEYGTHMEAALIFYQHLYHRL